MGALKIIALAFAASVVAEAKWNHHHKREVTTTICDPANDITKIQCYCVTDNYDRNIIRSANCHLVKKGVQSDAPEWDAFDTLENTNKITFSNTMGIAINYVPTKAITYMSSVLKLEIKYGNIERIQPSAFSNLTLIEEIVLSSNQIKSLAVNAFSHHRDLTSIVLDTNELVEINRDVFVDLPSLAKLFLTNNRITTIHDKAFVHLVNLQELEMYRNGLFSLNSETFSGLVKLQRLDLSGNNIEVIGDNTFLPLVKLETLNLDGNKIQMLDEKAFSGLAKLTVLSLAHNNLSSIQNLKTFDGLGALKFLSLKSNQLIELKAQVMAPILRNFYGNTSTLDVEDNKFPCDCRLEWFTSIINKTQNNQLRIAMENLKCIPDASVKVLWENVEETEKNDGKVLEDEEPQANGEYEYYDDVQLNGKLFYIDVRDLINCTSHKRGAVIKNTPATELTTTTTKATTSPMTTKQLLTTVSSTKAVANELQSTTVKTIESLKPSVVDNVSEKDSTTMRLATVSAKPVANYDHDMASDEARTEKTTKAHRSIQDNVKEPSRYTNNANSNINGATNILSVILSFRLCILLIQ